jgi:hypothetical protein
VPDHATIARFRVRHEHALSDIFSQVLGLCADRLLELQWRSIEAAVCATASREHDSSLGYGGWYPSA